MTDEPGAERPSIWQPLDGSAPQPAAAPAAHTFRKPEPRPLGAALAPGQQPAQPVDPAAYGDRPVYTLADWLPRLGAYLIDNILFGAVLLLISVPIGVGLGMTVEESLRFYTGGTEVPDGVTAPAAAWAVFAAQVLLQGALPAFFLVRWNGQTPGKRVANVRVVTDDGAPLTLGRALKRELLGKTLVVGVVAVFTLLLGFVLNYLWPLWDRENRTGHDVIGATRVVRVPPAAAPKQFQQ